jgi:hypothetical protein
MPPDTIDALLETRRGFLIAAAGCGKTEAIATAIARSDHGRHLVLTHTNAGVKALRDRLRRFKVPEQRFRVDTLAGWCLRYAASFPCRSGLAERMPTGGDWSRVYPAASKVLATDAVQDVIRSTYVSVFVDEYQDCVASQHAIVLQLAGVLPCRILGDPLQGIFDFTGERLVDWDIDIAGAFEELPPLTEPHRWRGNALLGNRLTALREALLTGTTVDFRVAPLQWRKLEADSARQLAAQAAACEALFRRPGSIVALRRWPKDCYAVGERLQGRFTCMEEMDCKQLLQSATAIENSHGIARCKAVFAFIDACITGVATPLRTIRQAIVDGRVPDPGRLRLHVDVAQAVVAVARTPGLAPVADLLASVDAIKERRVFRLELWHEMKRALRLHAVGRGGSLRDAAWDLRNRLRRQGRSIERRTISRTLLVKGLEFDHAIVLDASDHDARNFYVAATRASTSLTICSAAPTQRFET